MKRGLKLGFGIGLLVLGLFATIAGAALLALVGTDGTFELPRAHAHSDGHALLFDAIYVRGELPTSGDLSTTLRIEAEAKDEPVFIGVGPTADVARYLEGVRADRVVQVNWPGGVRTEPIEGTRTPSAPADQIFWRASASGQGDVSMDWVVTDGDWTIVVMNADGSAEVDVEGSVTVTLPVLGPVSLTILIAGVVMLVVGTLLTISGAKTPRPVASSAPPPRPDAV